MTKQTFEPLFYNFKVDSAGQAANFNSSDGYGSERRPPTEISQISESYSRF